MNKIGKWAAAALLGAGLAGCGQVETPPLAGARLGGPFVLTDQDGHRFDSKALRGRYTAIYFGYTYCPDVCPTDLLAIGQGLKAFEKSDPAKAAKVQPLFVSVDPARDTPPVLKQYVAAFHPRLIGLTGSAAEIEHVTKLYAVTYRAQPPAPGTTGYLVDHSRATLLFGPDGAPIALLPADAGGPAVAAALAKYVS